MAQPHELSVAEIRKYMLANGCKVTNHALVKHFKRFLTHPQTQHEARKQFKTYVNILSTIKNENNQKFLILRKKYINECPADEIVERAVAAATNEAAPSSPGGVSVISESGLNASPFRLPPPYKPPPNVSTPTHSPAIIDALAAATPPTLTATTGLAVQQEHVDNYRDCVQEFTTAISRIDPTRLQPVKTDAGNTNEMDVETRKPPKSISRTNSAEESNNASSNKENIARFSFSSGNSATSSESAKSAEKTIIGLEAERVVDGEASNPISVKEATRKFNRMASEEESRIISPPAKKRPEKELFEEKVLPEVTLAHPKAKEWIVSMAKANYQELAKLANDYPELVKLQDPATTALHWAAKHGNEDVVKLIAGTYKADVNARTNGGYTPLHLAIQFGRENIFELLWNVYKANRDLMDWSGNKPLDYSQQRPSVSASTCSKIKARKKHTLEKDLGFLRIGSLNVRVKKTTEAFSNFLGVGNGNGSGLATMAAGDGIMTANRPHQRSHRHHRQVHHIHHAGTTRNRHQNPRKMATPLGPMGSHNVVSRASVPINSCQIDYDLVHKSWGSADNIPQRGSEVMMPPPPKSNDLTSKRSNKSSKRSSYASNTTNSPRDSIASSNSSCNLNSGYSSMPTTPNQVRAPICRSLDRPNPLADSDSDSACGFGSNWSVNGRSSSNNKDAKPSKFR